MTNDERIAQLERSLTNQPPNQEQIERIEGVRDEAKVLGQVIILTCADSRERSLALTHLEDATHVGRQVDRSGTVTDTQAWVIVVAVCVIAAVQLLAWLGIGRR